MMKQNLVKPSHLFCLPPAAESGNVSVKTLLQCPFESVKTRPSNADKQSVSNPWSTSWSSHCTTPSTSTLKHIPINVKPIPT